MAGAVAGFGLAAFAGPAIHRAVIKRNETVAIADVWAVISAEMRHQERTGYFDSPQCLASPKGCGNDVPKGGARWLDPILASSTPRAGYVRRFYSAGVLPDAVVRERGLSPSSTDTFAIVAVPLRPGKTGTRAFCGDASGGVYYTRDGSAPTVVAGRCARGYPAVR